MKYLMVTSFDYHWNRITNNRTYYTLGMIKWDIEKKPPVEGADTIFIKKHKSTKKLEKCWEGKVFQFEKVESEKTRIYFKVKIEKPIECPQQFIDRPEGWYDVSLLNFPITDKNEEVITAEDIKKLTIPQLFGRLSISSWIILSLLIIAVFQIGYQLRGFLSIKTVPQGIIKNYPDGAQRLVEMHNENMKKLYEAIVEEEHRAGLAKDLFEEGRHTDSISRLKILLEKEKKDFEEKVKDIIKSDK